MPPGLYLRHTSPILAHLANAPYLAAYYRPLPRRFVSPSSAPPTAPPGPSFPGWSTCFTSTWTNLNDWLTPRRRTGLVTDDDAMMTSARHLAGLACTERCPRTTSLPSFPLLDASGAYARPRALLSTSMSPMREIPQPSKTQAARFLHPQLEDIPVCVGCPLVDCPSVSCPLVGCPPVGSPKPSYPLVGCPLVGSP